MSFLSEIKRRKVFQVAAVYAVVAWLLVQIITSIESPLSLPDWSDTLVIVLLAIGFPIALIISWAFDVTPDGLVRDQGKVSANGGRTIGPAAAPGTSAPTGRSRRSARGRDDRGGRGGLARPAC